MGWLFTHRPKGMRTKDWLIEQRVLDADKIKAFRMNNHTAYVAYEVTGNGKTVVMALVIRIIRYKGQCGWKAMDETMGPYYYGCPKRVYLALSPLEQVCEALGLDANKTYAREWRRKVELALANEV